MTTQLVAHKSDWSPSIEIFCALQGRSDLFLHMRIPEQNELSWAQDLLGIGLSWDETEHRRSLLGRTETETEHLVAPRDQAEPSNLTPETRPSKGPARLARLVCRPDCEDCSFVKKWHIPCSNDSALLRIRNFLHCLKYALFFNSFIQVET